LGKFTGMFFRAIGRFFRLLGKVFEIFRTFLGTFSKITIIIIITKTGNRT
jgi:hypothetical protein